MAIPARSATIPSHGCGNSLGSAGKFASARRGPRPYLRVSCGPPSHIGPYVGAERVRVFRVDVAVAVDVALSADDIEAPICLAEIEFHLVTCAEKVPHGCDPTAEDTPYLRAHRALTKIFCKRHAQPAEIDEPRRRKRGGIERERQRLAVVHSDLGREQKSQIRNTAPHWTQNRDRRPAERSSIHRHDTRRRTKTHNAADRGRYP